MAVICLTALAGCGPGETATPASVPETVPPSTTQPPLVTSTAAKPTDPAQPEPRWIEVRGDGFVDTRSGEPTTADGITYDLSDDAAVEQMVITNLRRCISTVGDAIRNVDEEALGAADPSHLGSPCR